LLFVGDFANAQQQARAFWEPKLQELLEHEWNLVTTALGRFSRRIGEQVSDLKTKKIRVRLKETPEGLMTL
jgi:hypothetical protein